MRCLAKQRDHDLGVKSERGWGGSSETQGTEQAGLGAGLWEGGAVERAQCRQGRRTAALGEAM